jgi:hypothetical protein
MGLGMVNVLVSNYLQNEEAALLPKAQLGESTGAVVTEKRKKRGPKGPNPLSMKKKSRERQEPPAPRAKRKAEEEGAEVARRKRKRQRVGNSAELVEDGMTSGG